ncbi:MAG: hypothetical protein MJZ11_07845 [Lachnospiraceae bacterium]|nr:hypothetical protein [Lachnospiraceae bacterium]
MGIDFLGIGNAMNAYDRYMATVGNANAGFSGVGTGNAGYGNTGTAAENAGITGVESKTGKVGETEGPKPIVNPGASTKVQPGKKSSPAECETCKNRKYQDGSDEGDVSYKAPTHISPATSTAKAMSHEMEHVANAYSKAANGNGKVLQASVRLKMAVCPECGTSYCAGGETTTKIQYSGDKYSQNQKSANRQALVGANVDLAV